MTYQLTINLRPHCSTNPFHAIDIGNARIAGMDQDLQTNPPKNDWYEWALTSFYLSYILSEWMSVLWRLVPAHVYIFAIVMTWGLSASLQSVVTSYPQLVFLRAVLGIGEAAFTGVPFYLSFFFRREELAYRTAVFISAAPLATGVASSVAYLVLWLAAGGEDGGGRGGANGGFITPWRLLFLIEGFPSVILAAVAWHKVPDTPGTAHFLTPRERKVAKWRLRDEKRMLAAQQERQRQPAEREDEEEASSTTANKNKPSSFSGLKALRDPATWLTATILFLANTAYSSLPVFLPTVLHDMGYTVLAAQAMAAPPYLASFLSVLVISSLSDASRSRSPYIILSALSSAVGYFVLATSGVFGLGNAVRYAAVYPAAVGFFNVVTLTIAWNINNGRGTAERGVGFAILQFVGQCGPLVGTRLYPREEGPYYARGMAVCCASMFGVAVLAALLRFWLGRVNERMDREERGLGFEAVGDQARGLNFRGAWIGKDDNDKDDHGKGEDGNTDGEGTWTRRRSSGWKGRSTRFRFML